MENSEIILFQTEDGSTKIEVRLEGETVWLTLNQLAELFVTTKQNISLHVKNILSEGELTEAATVKEYLTVQQEGSRTVSRSELLENPVVANFATTRSKLGKDAVEPQLLQKTQQFNIWAARNQSLNQLESDLKNLKLGKTKKP